MEENDDEIPIKKIKISRTDTIVLDAKSENNDTLNINETQIVDGDSENKEEVNNVSKTEKLKTSESLGLEENLLCSICQELFYNAHCIQPCLHSFCAHCLLDWRISDGTCCPICRGELRAVVKNHQLQNIVDKYAAKNPCKLKSNNSMKEADEKVKSNKDVLYSKMKTCTYTFSTSSDFSTTNEQNSCSLCGYPNSNSNTSTATNSSVVCSTGHSQCNCCNSYIPSNPTVTDTNTAIPKVRCEGCNNYYCYILLGNCSSCQYGCIHRFKDYLSNSNLNACHDLVPPILSDNFYETNVVRNYLNDKNKTPDDMYREALHNLDSGHISMTTTLRTGANLASLSSSALCTSCCEASRNELIFQYSANVIRTDLPNEVVTRPDCYYGRNCRTQRTRPRHAANYNHVCEQIRFH